MGQRAAESGLSAKQLEEEVRRVMNSLFGVSAEAKSNWDRLESLVESKVANVAAKVELLREERIGHVRTRRVFRLYGET